MNKQILVMVIEDEKLLLEAIQKKLETAGFSIICYQNANEGLKYLRDGGEIPDIIWLDYYLRDMDGMDFMKILKGDSRFSGIPVIVVSNSANIEKVDQMMALGAKKYVLKAEKRLDEIIEDIKKIVEESR